MSVLEREPEVVTNDDDENPEERAHYVAKDKLADAIINGTPVTALCGYEWVPHRDPERFPICRECKRRYDAGMRP